jgi:predicted DNA-binding protein with PD1-like motif
VKWSEGRVGRVFVLRLEDRDTIPECIEAFARDHDVNEAVCVALGGIGSGKVIAGPEDADATPITPLVEAIENVHETAAIGTIFPSEDGTPRLHMHGALGRSGRSRTGCFRTGVEVWKTFEVVLVEISGTGMRRRFDPSSGFEVLSAD